MSVETKSICEDVPTACSTGSGDATGALGLASRFQGVRRATEALCDSLAVEDYVIQSMPDVSPTKWHLAHTSWFFETFILEPHQRGYSPFSPPYTYLFNSYYVAVGDRHCRAYRGLLSRPTVAEVFEYRRYIDEQMAAFLRSASPDLLHTLRYVIELGLNHEQQHQELMLTDIKHVFWVNPLRPAYRARTPETSSSVEPIRWHRFDGGMAEIGHGDASFAFDNESPQHRVWAEPFLLASRPITNREYLAFVNDGGYRRPELWLSDGWATVQQQEWHAPLYWIQQENAWWNHTLSGLRIVEGDEPVCHVSYYEADAFARWSGARLPTEEEWEIASKEVPIEGNCVESGALHPQPAAGHGDGLRQMFGDVWEWTASAYSAYPGYRPARGALGEYNGKFMCNQFVLRGGSCVTPRSHIRRTYRNFFHPDARWQFTGIRLARDVA
jgi:ergothioneine biosynthesis protein EgtB